MLNDMATVTRATVAKCDVRTVASARGAEVYITATPPAGVDARRQATDIYDGIAAALRRERAWIVGERLFASSDAIGTALKARGEAYGDLDDGVMPTLLRTQEAGVVAAQVHAVRGIARPAVLRHGECGGARKFEWEGLSYLACSGLRGKQDAPEGVQARQVFEAAEELLKSAGGTLFDVARTWLWMDDILSWYDELNLVRTGFFTERGLMGGAGTMPASTGIGVSPAGGRIALDLFAAWGCEGATGRFHAAGNQRSAYEYGSAFARAARARTPGGVTVFCSGTAAIDAAGKTCYLGDIAKQVKMTVENVIAVLRDTGCSGEEVVQAMAYCATPEVAEHFAATWAKKLPWPCVTLLGDVCRHDLLFEIEVTACRGTREG